MSSRFLKGKKRNSSRDIIKRASINKAVKKKWIRCEKLSLLWKSYERARTWGSHLLILLVSGPIYSVIVHTSPVLCCRACTRLLCL